MQNLIPNILTAIRSGADPMQTIMTVAANNPGLRQAQNILHGKNAQQLEQTARNMCRERGINPEDALRQLGIR